MKKLLLVINEDRFFLSHRRQIAILAQENGWDVTIVTKDTGSRGEIEKMGLGYIELPVNPTGMNPLQEFKTLRFLYKLFRKNPDATVHLVGLKNMLWGGMAARLTKNRGTVYAVSGLGTLFGDNANPTVARALLQILRFDMGAKHIAVIFQNEDDRGLFLKSKVVDKERTWFSKGSGVKLSDYPHTALPDGEPVVVIFTARMLKEKGVADLIAAANMLRPEYEGKVEFWLCGGLSSNPNALSEDEMNRLADGKYIKWLGHRTDVAQLLQKSSVMCFPSYYREGVPKSLLEASAIGRPIITCDSVGCRDTVREGVNGFLVPPKSPAAIADRIKRLVDNPDMRRRMGAASHEIAEAQYDVDKVAELHLQIYDSLRNA